MFLKYLRTLSGGFQTSPRGPPWPPSPPERWPSAPKGAPWTAQHESEVPKVGSNRGRGIKKFQSGQGQWPLTPTPVFQRSPRTPKKRPGRALGPSEACKSCVSCRILVVPADSLISTLLKYHAISCGYGGHAQRLQYIHMYIYIYIYIHTYIYVYLCKNDNIHIYAIH